MSKIAKALNEARKTKNDLEDEIRIAKQDAAREIDDLYSERMQEARANISRLEQARRDEIEAKASHPWDGKRVFRMVPTRINPWSSRPGPDRRDEGIVEVVRQSSEFPANLTWRIPSLGSVIVRKLKKDKTPSLQFYAPTGVIGGDAPQAWQLAE